MRDNTNPKHRLESMQQELNQFSRAANDILGRQYLNADTLRRLNIEVPPNRTAFWCIFILLTIFLSFVTQTFIPGLIATAYVVFKIVSEQTKQNEFLANYFMTLLLVKGDSSEERFPVELHSAYCLYDRGKIHFGSYHTACIPEVKHGDVIISINSHVGKDEEDKEKLGKVLCYIALRKEGEMPYMTWDGSSFTKRGELAPANHSVKALALQFVDKLA